MNNVISPLPTTADLLRFYSQSAPAKVALKWGENACTFAQLHEHLTRCTTFLHNELQSLDQSQIVAVASDDFLWHWVTLLALEQLGRCSMSVLPNEVNAEFVQQFAVGALIAAVPKALQVPMVIVNAQTLAAQKAESHNPAFEQDRFQHTAVRLLRTSGTTGQSKRIVLDRRMWSGWTDSWDWYCSYGPSSVCMIQHPFSISGIYATATACLRAGGTVIKRDGRGFLQALQDFGVSHATVLPMDLNSILKETQGVSTLQKKIMLTAFGGVLSGDMVTQCLAGFAHHVVDMYGTNEVAFIGAQIAGPNESVMRGIGLWPGVAVRIVNEQNQSLPDGEVGYIKVRTPLMATRYEGDLLATNTLFREGWFWPGDLGRMLPNGRLELTGRIDDLINIGGIKVNPASAESKLCSLNYVRDAAVLMVPRPNGTQAVVIAVVFEASGQMERLQKETRASMTAFDHLVEWVQLDAIPRTPTGKVQRAELRAYLEQQRSTRKP